MRTPPQGLPRWLTAIVILVVLVGGIGIAVAFVQTKPKTEKEQEQATFPLVEVATVELGTQPVVMQLNGQVMAAQKVALMPEVGGRIVWHADELVPGGRFEKGAPLVRIDSRDYALMLKQQQAQLANQQLALKVEKGRGKVAEREWEIFKKEREQAGLPPPPDQGADGEGALALRAPHLKSAQVSVSSARSSLSRAKLQLSKTMMTAPFNAFVQMENVEKGQLVSPGSQLATLVGTDAFWVQVSIPVDKLDFVKLPRDGQQGSSATVRLDTGRDQLTRKGHVIRLLGDLDQVGRLARLLVEVEDPFQLKSDQPPTSNIPLLLGAFVTVSIDGVDLHDVAQVPRRALYENNKVFALKADNTLTIKKVDIVWGSDDMALVTGPLENGERVVISKLATPVEGMKLRVAKPANAEANAKGAEPKK